MIRWLSLLVVLANASTTSAADFRIDPPHIVLTGPRASQRLLVVATSGAYAIGDVTPDTHFTSSNPSVATVDSKGIVRPHGNGTATISATVGAGSTKTTVKVEKYEVASDWSFRNHIIPLLTRIGCNSGACHGALAGKGGFKLSLRGYAPADDYFVLTRQAQGRRINKLEPARSLMLLKPTMAISHGGGLKIAVPSPEYDVISDWIASGAPGLSENDPRIQKVEVYPAEAILKPKDRLQVLVRAVYSDGHSEDVTRLAKFFSTEDTVAGVDENGLVQIAAPGEAAVTASFANLVAAARFVAPLPNAVDPKVFAEAPRSGFIDKLVLKKLEELHIPPSPQSTDAEFIRRVYLDAAGILPTPKEVTAFLADGRANKRALLIEGLLARPEFVDYWTYKWSDLLLVSSRKLPIPGMRAFYHFVRDSVADNKPWDKFARAILTAQGSSLQNGAANYFAMHKDVSSLTETTAETFMGMSIQCARCHNHPMEKWTQDQYWGMANLFARVAIKNGDHSGEVTVQSEPTGDILHPRRGIPMAATPLDGKPCPPNVDRRRYFADWLTAPDNPFFARAIVNRVWRNYMGRGLVEAEDDLRQTNPPSNAELLDALAKHFVDGRYDLKDLMRTIMNSAAYQRSSISLPGNKTDDRYYSRYLIRRLPAEVVLDAYSAITKVPTAFTQVQLGPSGGESATGDYPLGTRALQLPDTQLVSQFLDEFGRPERSRSCSCERQQESSVAQALHLNNGQTLNAKLRDKKSRVEDWLKEKIGPETALDRVYMLALCREPTPEEWKHFRAVLADAQRDPHQTRRETLEDLFWAVLTGREFLFNR